MARLKTIEDFQAEVNEAYGEGEWTVKSYIGTSTIVEIEHKCGTVRTISRAKNFLKGETSCKKCKKTGAGRPRITFKELQKLVKVETDGAYELVELVDSTDFTVNHIKCDRPPFNTSSTRFFTRGQRCQCTKKGKVGKKSTSEL